MRQVNDDWFEMFGAGFVAGAFTLGLVLCIWFPATPSHITYTITPRELQVTP